MKRMKGTMFVAVTAFLAAALAACSGGGGGAVLPPNPTNLAASQGVIVGFGSVIVNGVAYSTTGATVTIDDNPSTADLLKIGMVVKVRGTADDATQTGTATEISARDAVEGTIDAVDAANKTVTVMGQKVQIEDNVTRLNDDAATKTFAAAAFVVGDKVEVHAFPDDLGNLRATRVAKKTTAEFEAKGFITGINGNSLGLSPTAGAAATLTVNFAGALPSGAAIGSLIQVKSATAPAAGAITATTLRLEDAIGVAGDTVKVEGIVTGGTVDSFALNGKPVTTSAATLFVGGLKTDFAVGAHVEAQGALGANSVLTAAKITFRSNIKIEANVTAFTDKVSLTVLGKQVAIDQFTRTDNGPVAVGSHVEVRAKLDRDGNPIATRIVVRNPDVRAFIQAPISAVDTTAGTMTVMGTAITTNAGTEFRTSSDTADAAVTAAVFFGQLKANVTVVKVRWNAGNTALPVDQAEIEVTKTLATTNDVSAKGVVSALGSVFVNGVEFKTGGAAVRINGVPDSDANLTAGMVVKVRGTIDDATRTGTATLVEAATAAAGIIDAVDPVNKTITVMGQIVRIEDNVTRLNDDNAQKVFADGTFAVGQRVEVNGFVDDTGGIRASRVAKKTTGEFTVKGFVVTSGASSFGLGLTPGGAATLAVNGTLPAGAAVGSIVEVKAAAAPNGGAVTATLVKLEDNIGATGEKAKVEGIVISGDLAGGFVINGQKVLTSATTVFEGGLSADFAVGVKVEAEGPLDANRAIVASKITFRSNIKIEADVSAISATSLTLIGQTVAINGFTRLDTGIIVGTHVEVRAVLDRNGNLLATRVVSRGANTRAFLQGPVSASNSTAGTMTILGNTITTGAGTVFRSNDNATDATAVVTAANFFPLLKPNITVVKVRWAAGAGGAVIPPTTIDQAEIQVGN